MTEGRRGPQFRAMTEDDLADGLRLSRASGWNQTLEDWRQLLALGPGLFRVGVDDGRVVAAAGAVRYGDALAWICMVVVDPTERGRGVGTAIFDEVLSRCQAEVRAGRLRTVGLDATPGGRRIYVQRGFVDGPALARLRVEPSAAAGGSSRSVDRLAEQDLAPIVALDREVFGADRAPLLRWALGAAPELAWVARAGGRVSGYCFGRHGDRSNQVGPVVADDMAVAVELVRACLSAARGRSVVLDARVEPDWLRALGDLGFREERPFTRMYLDEAQPAPRSFLERAVFGPEFG
jgi:GNAT superfamily N-acetyltransferase